MLLVDEIWEWLLQLDTEQALALTVLLGIAALLFALYNPNIALSLNKAAKDSDPETNDPSEDDVNAQMGAALGSMAKSVELLSVKVAEAVTAISASTTSMQHELPKSIGAAMKSGIGEAFVEMDNKQKARQDNIESSLEALLNRITELMTTLADLKTDLEDIKTRLATLENDFSRLSEAQRWAEVIQAMATLQGAVEQAQQHQKGDTDDLTDAIEKSLGQNKKKDASLETPNSE